MSEICFIVNPNSGGGRAAREWKLIKPLLANYFAYPKIYYTQKSGEATALVKKAVSEGFKKIVSVGGDGTLNEVVNGFMQLTSKRRETLTLGVFPLGSGDDFAKSLLWPKETSHRLKALFKARTQSVDVGIMSFLGKDGKKQKRHFINIADFGLGGEVVARVNRSSKWLGGKIAYLTSTIESLLSIKPFSVELNIEGKKQKFHDIILGIVANGSYFGGGLCVAPQAKLNDGLFEVILVEKIGVLDFLKLLPKLYLRRSLNVNGVRQFQASYISVKNLQNFPVLLDCDGEQPGKLPVTFEVLPQEINVVIV